MEFLLFLVYKKGMQRFSPHPIKIKLSYLQNFSM